MDAARERPPSYQLPTQAQAQTTIPNQLPSTQQLQQMTAPPVCNQRAARRWKGVTVTAIVQLVLGGLIPIFGILGLVSLHSFWYVIGTPIWGGICFVLVAGILGTVGGMKKSKCLVIAYLVMSILACLAAALVVLFAASSISLGRCFYGSYGGCSYSGRSVGLAIDSLLVVLGLTEFVVSIVGASLTCCCISTSDPQQIVVQYPSSPLGQPMQNMGSYNPGISQQQPICGGAFPAQQITTAVPMVQYQPQPQMQANPQPPNPVQGQAQALTKN